MRIEEAVVGDAPLILEYIQKKADFDGAMRGEPSVVTLNIEKIKQTLFNDTPFAKVRVVILGQDPYHGPGQAHGLCFSVLPGVKVPPSLANMYKELASDLGITQPNHGCLTSWAKQGVLLLNATLTVEQANAGAHQGRGWEKFTDQAICALNEQREGIVFLLWGSYAQKKGAFIDQSRHLVLKSVHPSPLSAYRGFLGCEHFSATNNFLQKNGQLPINWQLPDEPEMEF